MGSEDKLYEEIICMGQCSGAVGAQWGRRRKSQTETVLSDLREYL